jgi:hypothetical protein
MEATGKATLGSICRTKVEIRRKEQLKFSKSSVKINGLCRLKGLIVFD